MILSGFSAGIPESVYNYKTKGKNKLKQTSSKVTWCSYLSDPAVGSNLETRALKMTLEMTCVLVLFGNGCCSNRCSLGEA